MGQIYAFFIGIKNIVYEKSRMLAFSLFSPPVLIACHRHASEVLPTLMYRQAFTHFNMGYSSAIGLFLFAVMFILMGPLYTKFVLKEK